jgi:hypothetical protein
MKKLWIFLACLAFCLGLSAQTYNEAQKELDKYLLSLENRLIYLEKHPSPTSAKELRNLIAAIDSLNNLRLSTGKTYYEKIMVSGAKENIPEEMSHREFGRRLRSLSYQASQKALINQKNQGFSGLLVNYKTGINEIAVFTINRIDVSGLPADVISLNPGEHLSWNLLPGDYEARIICGSYRGSVRFNVNPSIIKHFDGQNVYWFCAKTMADW